MLKQPTLARKHKVKSGKPVNWRTTPLRIPSCTHGSAFHELVRPRRFAGLTRLPFMLFARSNFCFGRFISYPTRTVQSVRSCPLQWLRVVGEFHNFQITFKDPPSGGQSTGSFSEISFAVPLHVTPIHRFRIAVSRGSNPTTSGHHGEMIIHFPTVSYQT